MRNQDQGKILRIDVLGFERVFCVHGINNQGAYYIDGLTMADDQNTVVKKMLHSSSGQRGEGYDVIGPANHLDYQKWNNHQRKEATEPVFRVMGQFYGLPNLFARTHEMFEKSWIY